MRWNTRPPFDPSVLVEKTRLRRAALRYAGHGWPVTPGAVLAGQRFVCGRAGCPTVGAHPALDRWEWSASTQPSTVATWWQHRAYTVLLVTGTAFDVLEVPAHLGSRILGATTLGAGIGRPEVRGPVAVTPTGRWMFWVRPGDPLRPELADCLDVIRHGESSWVPAPPTRAVEGRVRWAVSPEQVQWRLPASYPVQSMLVDALGAPGRPVRPAPLPRQVSTTRRAA